MSLLRSWLRRGRDGLRRAAGRRDGLRMFHFRPETADGPAVVVGHGRVQDVLGADLLRCREFDQAVDGVPHDAQVFYHADGRRVASWGLLIPGVARWPLTEVDGLLLARRPVTVLISFHTLEAYRGRGLYPALLRAMCAFSAQGEIPRDLLIWCHRSNHASVRGIQKAGFADIATVRRSLSGRSLLVSELDPGLAQALGLSFSSRN